MTDPSKSPRTTFEALAWVDRAACGQPDAPMMYPHGTDTEGIELAKATCQRCPVRSECLARALEIGEQWGVWGGMSEEERRQLKRRRSRAQKPKAASDQQKPRKRNRKPVKVVPIVPVGDLL